MIEHQVMASTVHMGLRIRIDSKAKLEAIAESQGRTLSNLIQYALAQFLNQQGTDSRLISTARQNSTLSDNVKQKRASK